MKEAKSQFATLVHYINIAVNVSLFAEKELNFSEEFTSRWQNCSFVPNKYLSQTIISNIPNQKNERPLHLTYWFKINAIQSILTH